MEAGLTAWDRPEAGSPMDRLNNAAKVAEHLVCATRDTAAVREHIRADYPETWPLAERIAEVIKLPEQRTLASWRRSLVGMLSLAEELFDDPSGESVPLNRLITCRPFSPPRSSGERRDG